MAQIIKENAKAIAGFITAFLTWLGTSLAEDGISSEEWSGLIGPVIAGLAVWWTKNAATEEQLLRLSAWKHGEPDPYPSTEQEPYPPLGEQ